MTLVVSALITPATDPISLALVAAPLYLLYEIGIVLSHFFVRTRLTPTTAPTTRHHALRLLPLYLHFRLGGGWKARLAVHGRISPISM